jgi:membrane associated rhomboid family serine protease
MGGPTPTPDILLRLCAASEPAAWFPSAYASETGTDRDSLDEPLNQLRLGGLVRIGGWEPAKGQWYVLTDAGRSAVAGGRPVVPRADVTPVVLKPAVAARPGRMTAWDRGEAVRRALLSPGGAPITWTLLAVQIIVFAGGLALAVRGGTPVGVYIETGDSPVLRRFALTEHDIARGEWWRLLSYSVVHGGAMHLLMNGIGLIALGPLLEKALGPVRFLLLWVFGALGGGVAVVLSSPAGATIGASGALCALLTAAVVFIWLNRQHLGQMATSDVLRRLSTAILLTALISFSPGISWQAHLGGAVAGVVTGALLTYHRFGTAEQRWAALLGLVLLPAAGLYPLFQKGILHWPKSGGVVAEPPRDWSAEWPDFRSTVGKATETARKQAFDVKERLVEPLRDQPPQVRKPGLVVDTLRALDVLRSQQDALSEQVRRAGPYRATLLEEARKTAEGYLLAEAELTTALRTCLSRGADWQLYSEGKGSDEQRLQELANVALEADLRWRHMNWILARRVLPDRSIRDNPQITHGRGVAD